MRRTLQANMMRHFSSRGLRRIWNILAFRKHMPCKTDPVSHLPLPNEILEIIIRELASDDEDNKSLASCRLASYVLCSLATPVFFSSIRLTDTTGDGVTEDSNLFVKRATKLNEILTNYNIAASVHALTLCCHHRTLKDFTSGIMSAILHRLPHIRSFSLEARLVFYFFSFPEDFASAIRALCRSPSLTTLSLDSIQDFPFTAITGCPNLQHLRLWQVRYFGLNNVNSKDEISSPQLLYLDSLDIDGNSVYTLGLCDASVTRHFTRLKNLQFKGLFHTAGTLSYGWDIMLLASQTLVKLDLIVDHNDELEQVLNNVPFNLGWFPALRHLKIQRRSSYKDHLAALHFLTRLLSISSTGIEVLEIETTWNSVWRGHGKNLFSSDAGWSTLDQLSTSEMFASLRKIVLHLDLWMNVPRDSLHLQPILESERNLTLPYVNDLFPLFKALTDPQRTLELHLAVVRDKDDDNDSEHVIY